MNPRRRRIERQRRIQRDYLAHLGPLARPAALGTEVKRFGVTWKCCSAPPPLSDKEIVLDAAILGGPPGQWARVPSAVVAWRRQA
jgi:hypothetical protein